MLLEVVWKFEHTKLLSGRLFCGPKYVGVVFVGQVQSMLQQAGNAPATVPASPNWLGQNGGQRFQRCDWLKSPEVFPDTTEPDRPFVPFS